MGIGLRASHYIRMGVWGCDYSGQPQAGSVNNTLLGASAALQNPTFNSIVLVQIKSLSDGRASFVFVEDCFPSDY
jgi:hypothetical protein